MKLFETAAIVAITGAALAIWPIPARQAAVAAPGGDSNRITRVELDNASFCGIGRKPSCNIKIAVARGLFPTGLQPQFAPKVKCNAIDEHWAISYTYKRNRENYHAGIDMPAPFGTAVRAVADGTVVGVYKGKGHLGNHIILRHTPQDTGIPVWIYTVYAHFERLPEFHVGDRVHMGEVLGPTGNSGTTRAHVRGKGRKGGGHHRPGGEAGGHRPHSARAESSGGHRHGGGGHNNHGGLGGGVRRPAVHFGVYFSANPQYAALRGVVVPRDGYWMDPVALFRAKPPFDSASMRALPARDKHVPIPYALPDGSVHPAGTKLIWPYACRPG